MEYHWFQRRGLGLGWYNLRQGDFGLLGLTIPDLITYVIVLITAFSVHEFSHAWTANRFGDDTPRMNGRLTLNPLAHLDLIGSIMLLFAGIGWAKPVPVNPYALRRSSRAALMWVSLAGPLSNVFLAVLAAIPFRLGLVSSTYATGQILPTLPQFLSSFVYVNISLMLFNLIPLAPLDGEKVLEYFLPPNMAQVFEQIRPYGPMILMGLFVIGQFLGTNVLGWLIGTPAMQLSNFLMG
jgi:Zn-dependent protease